MSNTSKKMLFPPTNKPPTQGQLAHETSNLCKLEDDHIARLILRTDDPRFIKWGKEFIAANLLTAQFGDPVWYEIQCLQASICAVEDSGPVEPWLSAVKHWKAKE
jgi:hypothetical protein